MNQFPIDSKTVARNIWRDTLQDGLVELGAGVGMLFLSILIQSRMVAFVAILAIFGPLLIRRLKVRYTYPRIGYVALPEKRRKDGPLIAFLLGVAVIIFGLVIFKDATWETTTWYRWTPLLPAIVFQGAFLSMAVKSGLRRYYLVAALTLLLGIGATQLNLPGNMDNLWVYLMTMGAILIIWGVVLLVTFLRRNPVRAEEAQDGK